QPRRPPNPPQLGRSVNPQSSPEVSGRLSVVRCFPPHQPLLHDDRIPLFAHYPFVNPATDNGPLTTDNELKHNPLHAVIVAVGDEQTALAIERDRPRIGKLPGTAARLAPRARRDPIGG